MGLCQECTVLIEGRSVEACRVAVRKGLSVRSVDRGT
jgi:aerobic-type carbon monoxide dehydrogenase small subunit (CoxS/CutS family)